MKNSKTNRDWGSGRGGGQVVEGQGGCERRSEVFVIIQKKSGGGMGVRSGRGGQGGSE